MCIRDRDIIWNIEKGMSLTVDDIANANIKRVQIFNNMQNFFDQYDLLICPSTIVPPFPVEQTYVKSCDGINFSNYIEWLNIVSAVTLTGSPALSLPYGFTPDGLPVGLQVISRFRNERDLLSGAAFIESNINFKNYLPIDVKY